MNGPNDFPKDTLSAPHCAYYLKRAIEERANNRQGQICILLGGRKEGRTTYTTIMMNPRSAKVAYDRERGGKREGEERERERERDRVITYWEVGRSLGGHASAISACIYYGGRGTDRMGQGLTGDDGA